MSAATRLALMELQQYRALARWLTRRPKGGPGELPFGNTSAVKVVLGAFLISGTVETVVLHLVLPWERIRLVVDVLSVWGLLWMLGYAAALWMHPHLVAEPGLVVRSGLRVNLLLPWHAIEEVAATTERSLPSSKPVQVEDDVVHVPVGSMTNVEVRLRRPMDYEGSSVSRVTLWADDPQALVTAARGRTTRPASPPPSAP